MAEYADITLDFIPRFPRALEDDEFDRTVVLLQDASFWLDMWVPGLAEAVAGGNEMATTAAKLLVVAMVRRTLLQPDAVEGAQSQTDAYGPFSFTVAYRNPDGNLFLYDRELTDLTNLLLANRSQAVSMRSRGL